MTKSFLLAAAVLLVLMSAGCGLLGGGGEEEVEFTVIEFEETEPTPTPPVAEVVKTVGVDKATLVKLRYLYSHQVKLESLRRIIRDLENLGNYGDESKVGLGWVIEVHKVTQDSDDFQERVKAAGIPESQRGQYEYLFVGLLEVMDIIGYASLRLLEGATLIGPDGRMLDTLEPGERERFVTMVREARYFLGEGDGMMKNQIKVANSAISRVGLR